MNRRALPLIVILVSSFVSRGALADLVNLATVDARKDGQLSTAEDEELPFSERLAAAGLARTFEDVDYDPAYVVLDYPGGDVPANTGVCTDVVVRSYRTLGVDLQKRVHEDMRANFGLYPKNWGLRRADKNIDHRRVPNLQTFFSRFGEALPISDDAAGYEIGDLIAYDLNGRGLVHIAIVVAPASSPDERWIVHNIGGGPVLQDRLLDWEVIGHYRYHPGE